MRVYTKQVAETSADSINCLYDSAPHPSLSDYFSAIYSHRRWDQSEEILDNFKNSLRLLTQKVCRDFEEQEIPKRPVGTVVDTPPRVVWDVERLALSDLRISLTIGLLRLPEYRAVAEAAETDPEFEDGILLDGFGLLHKPEPDNLTRAVVTNFLWQYLQEGARLDWNETRFHETFDELMHQVRRKSVVNHTTLPLSNLKIDVDELEFGAELTLLPATTDELERWINADRSFPLLGTGPPQWDSRYVDRPAVLHVRQTVVGRPPSTDLQKDLERLPRVNANQPVTALRLVMNAPISIIFQEQETEGLIAMGGHSTHWGWAPPNPGPPATLDEEMAAQVIRVWRLLQESPNVELLSLPLRRWESSLQRQNPEDKLIDAWISLEALILGGPEGELSYRAAMRLAEFLGANGSDRKAIYDATRVSYTWRSIIVHGSKNGRFAKRNPLDESVRLTSEYLRTALIKMLELPNRFDPSKLESDLLRRQPGSP